MCARTHKKTSILQTVVVIYVLHHFSCLKNFCFPSVCGGSVVEMHSRSPHLIAVYTQFWKTLCAPLKIYLPPRMVVCDAAISAAIAASQTHTESCSGKETTSSAAPLFFTLRWIMIWMIFVVLELHAVCVCGWGGVITCRVWLEKNQSGFLHRGSIWQIITTVLFHNSADTRIFKNTF